MILKLSDALIGEYNWCKDNLIKRIENGYRALEISSLKKSGFSDDDILMAEMIGVYKGITESKIGWLNK